MFGHIFWGIMITALLISCNTSSSESKGTTNSDSNTATRAVTSIIKPPENTDWVITPGSCIGKTCIGENTEKLITSLGEPDLSDAAMGKAWLTWYGDKDEHNKRAELNIYTTYADTRMITKAVQLIRITSSRFHTAEGLHVYDDYKNIESHYPSLSFSGKYEENGRLINIYDSEPDGIAFETVKADNQELCTAIIIHKKGKHFIDTYLPYHQNPVR